MINIPFVPALIIVSAFSSAAVLLLVMLSVKSLKLHKMTCDRKQRQPVIKTAKAKLWLGTAIILPALNAVTLGIVVYFQSDLFSDTGTPQQTMLEYIPSAVVSSGYLFAVLMLCRSIYISKRVLRNEQIAAEGDTDAGRVFAEKCRSCGIASLFIFRPLFIALSLYYRYKYTKAGSGLHQKYIKTGTVCTVIAVIITVLKISLLILLSLLGISEIVTTIVALL